jgi:hypothetical protein
VNAYCDKKAEEVIVRQQLVNMLSKMARDFSLFHSDKTSFRDHLISNLIGTRGSFSGIKAARM